ncbi:phage head-tail connector protein [Lacrimispora sp.]|uniref:phage head-tail connector protein n=1 Tax=Lacrimispora sp. TaxID=2719234 RepID=UPI0028671F32|nr:phage head-tail connector protein [Lacrimispora sp.]MDR7812072.1 phage head-tail connector protein [Lacrimispora sp.]
MDDIEKLKKLTGESDSELLSLLLEDAKEFVLYYTNRTEIVTGLQKTVRDLAVIALNRMGTEGESGRSEGGESYSFENAPKHIYDVLDRYRLARIGGRTYETKKEPPERVSP